MARNMDLPSVEIDGEAPFVMATKYPNGPVCIATEGRVRPQDQWFHPRAKISIKIEGSILIIPGDLIDKIGTSAGDEGDISAPGMVVRIN